MKFVFVCCVALLVVVGTSAQLGNSNPDCPVICPLHYAPICAKNSGGEYETFANDCKLRVKNHCGSVQLDFVAERNGMC